MISLKRPARSRHWLGSGGGWRARIGASLTALFLSCRAAHSAEDQVSVFGGVFFTNGWEDVFIAPWDLQFTRNGLVGAAYGREWPLRWRGFSAGVEGQLSWHFGDQDYGELAVPVVLRYSPEWSVPLRSFAYGLGVSHTSAVPQVEIDKGGASQRTLFYWMLEVDFGPRSSAWSGLLRIHHRSNGFGWLDTAGSSNYLTLGLRKRFWSGR